MNEWGEPVSGVTPQWAGGAAGQFEILDRAREAFEFGENVNAAERATLRAYDERIEAVRNATGVMLDHPFRQKTGATLPHLESQPGDDLIRRAEFQSRLDQLVQQFPDKGDIIAPHRDPLEDAREIARTSEERYQEAFSSQDGFLKYVSAFGGGAIAATKDPAQMATVALGFGSSAARTVGGRILGTAVREAAVNSGAEAAFQPAVQKWRKQAGLPNGLGEALRNIGFAALFGAGFGVAGRGVVEGVTAFRGVDDVVRAGVGDTPIRRAIDGDALEAEALVRRYPGPMTDEVRGALAALDSETAVRRAAPENITDDVYADLADASVRAAENPADIEGLARVVSDNGLDVPRAPDDVPPRLAAYMDETVAEVRQGEDIAPVTERAPDSAGSDAPARAGEADEPDIPDVQIPMQVAQDATGAPAPKMVRAARALEIERRPAELADIIDLCKVA